MTAKRAGSGGGGGGGGGDNDGGGGGENATAAGDADAAAADTAAADDDEISARRIAALRPAATLATRTPSWELLSAPRKVSSDLLWANGGVRCCFFCGFLGFFVCFCLFPVRFFF